MTRKEVKVKKQPMMKIILNEQTPPSTDMINTKKWILKNKDKLHSFLAFSRSKKKAAALASNQVAFYGERIFDRFFSIRTRKENNNWDLIINPKIKSVNGDLKEIEERCLTWPGKVIVANRHPGIIVSYWDQDCNFIENEFIENYEAQVWQHEIDHLNGKQEEFKPIKEERKISLPGRNDKCPCGSNKKFKKCCANNSQEK